MPQPCKLYKFIYFHHLCNTKLFVQQVHLSPSNNTSPAVVLGHSSTSWIQSVVPDTFSRRTREAISKSMITKSARIEICDILAHRIYAITEYPTSSEYTAICQALIVKYPVLADTIGNGFVSFVKCPSSDVFFISLHEYRDHGKCNYDKNLRTCEDQVHLTLVNI